MVDKLRKPRYRAGDLHVNSSVNHNKCAAPPRWLTWTIFVPIKSSLTKLLLSTGSQPLWHVCQSIADFLPSLSLFLINKVGVSLSVAPLEFLV